VSKAGLVLRDHQDLAKHMNTVVFHTKMVDYLDEMINESGDLSIYWSEHLQYKLEEEKKKHSHGCIQTPTEVDTP
jgi:hypothetical protein